MLGAPAVSIVRRRRTETAAGARDSRFTSRSLVPSRLLMDEAHQRAQTRSLSVYAARKVDQSAAQKVSHLEGGSFYADLLQRQYN